MMLPAVVLRAGLVPKAVLLCVLVFIAFVCLPLNPFSSVQLVRSTQRSWNHANEDQIPLSGSLNSGSQAIPSLEPSQSAIWNRTLGFEKLFVIGLPSRTDHRDQLTLAGSLTDIDFTFVNGVRGEDVLDRVLPPDAAERGLSNGYKGSWRAHMNVLQEIVAKNISTALIMEDDVDWDLRIRTQLEDLAQGIKTWNATNKNDDIVRSTFFKSRFTSTSGGQTSKSSSSSSKGGKTHDNANSTHPNARPVPAEAQAAPASTTDAYPHDTPYGPDWDLLWLGHCGVYFPSKEKQPDMPLHRVAILNDPTVPNHDGYRAELANDDLKHLYPEQTRVVHTTAENTCSLAYAVTQHAARQMLYEIGLQSLKNNYDIVLRWFCDGHARAPTDQWWDVGSLKREHGTERRCLTVQPQLFNHHRPVGNENRYSDISLDAYSNGHMNDVPHTINVRWSTMVNIPRLLAGRKDYIDSWPED